VVTRHPIRRRLSLVLQKSRAYILVVSRICDDVDFWLEGFTTFVFSDMRFGNALFNSTSVSSICSE
jgi:hypothetical protein